MKKVLGILMIVGMVIIMLPLSAVQAASIRNVKSFIEILGSPTSEQLQDMKKFDVAVCDMSLSNDQLKKLKAAGVIVLAYIPTTSIDKQYPVYNGLENQDYLKVNGQRLVNSNDISHDWLMDPRSKHYRQIVINTIKQNIYARCFDGVYLDTLNQAPEYLEGYATMDATSLNNMKNDLMAGSAQLCKDIRDADPSKLIAQNNGWRELVNYTAPYIDFLMWEDYPYDLRSSDAWLNQKRDNLINLRDQYQFKVVAVKFFSWYDYNGVQAFYDNARSYGFIPYAPWTSGALLYNTVNTYDIPPRSTTTTQTPSSTTDTQAPTSPVVMSVLKINLIFFTLQQFLPG